MGDKAIVIEEEKEDCYDPSLVLPVFAATKTARTIKGERCRGEIGEIGVSDMPENRETNKVELGARRYTTPNAQSSERGEHRTISMWQSSTQSI
jgi:hypothetical protein